MPDTPLDSGSTVARVVRDHERELFERWSEAQLASPDQRLDLIDPDTSREQCADLLSALAQALASATSDTFDDAGWQPVLQQLEAVSRHRDNSGFSPSDTASFVLSLKRPLLDLVDVETGEAKLDTETFWWTSQLIDRMALHTTEVYQQRREETIARQRREMEELSTPVIKVWDGILAMPLIGTLDTRRSQMVTEALLEALGSSGAEIAILDLTGVPAVDTRMAQHLMRTVAAARLMGADCILCGIRPQIAQTIVHLQISLGDIVTEASLASALRTAFDRTGLRVAPESSD